MLDSAPRTAGLRRALRQRGDPRRKAILLAALLVVSLALFADVAEDYLTGDPIVRWDVHLARWLHIHSSPTLVSVFQVATYAGSAVVLGAITAVACGVLLRRRRLNEALFLAFVAIGIELANGGVKLLFHRPRPELAFVHLDTYSFPSGHAASSTAVYGALAFVLARHAGVLARVAWGCAAVVVVTVVGFSRLYLGAHYLSDVLGGFSFGAAFLFASLLLLELYGDRELSWPAPARLRRRLTS
jgi:membrane-associated phospholipid phosphatase